MMNSVIPWVRLLMALVQPAPPTGREKGSVTIENVVWAIAVIAIAAIVIAAITAFVTNRSGELLGQ